MALKYLIVVGDPTSGGGEAIQGDPGWIIECIDGVSRPLVRVNDTVICGACGPTKVVEGASFFLTGGGLVAYDGCALACGHKLISKMQRLHSIGVTDASPRNAATSALQPAASDSQPASAFDEAFQFIDSSSGEALVGLDCLLLPESAADIHGKLSGSGCSPRCGNDKPDRIAAAIEAPSPLLL